MFQKLLQVEMPLMATVTFNHCLQTRIFPSEVLQRSHEEEISKIVAKDKLNVGKVAMFKNSLATTASLSAYVKVDDLVQFLVDLVKQVKS